MQAWARGRFLGLSSLTRLRHISHRAGTHRSLTAVGKLRWAAHSTTTWTSASWRRTAAAASLRKGRRGRSEREADPDHRGAHQRSIAAAHQLEILLGALVRTPREVTVRPYIVAGVDSSARSSPSIAESRSLSAFSVAGETSGAG